MHLFTPISVVDAMKEAETYSDEEATRRRDEALRRALNTPPPIKPIGKPKGVKPMSDQRQDHAVVDE